MLTRLYLDGIIFALQDAGGISSLWGEHIKRLDPHSYVIHDPGPNKNLIFNTLDLSQVKHAGQLNLSPKISRYLPVASAELKPGMIFHSSYYRRSLRRGVKSVVTVYDFAYERIRKGLAKFVHTAQKYSAIRNADLIVCISEHTRRDLHAYLPDVDERRTLVAHLGVAGDFYQLSAKPQETAKPFLLFVGSRGHYKNFPLVLEALRYLEGYQLRVVGGGPFNSEELQSITELGIKERVLHLGTVNNQILNQLYNQAHCLIYPSSYEGFGIPIAEAGQAGCPVIATRSSSIPEVHGDFRMLMDTPVRDELIERVRALEKVDLRAEVVQRCQQHVANFSWDRFHATMMSAYASL